jgi:hypothetical protein
MHPPDHDRSLTQFLPSKRNDFLSVLRHDGNGRRAAVTDDQGRYGRNPGTWRGNDSEGQGHAPRRHQNKVDESVSGIADATIGLLKPHLERPKAYLSSSVL